MQSFKKHSDPLATLGIGEYALCYKKFIKETLNKFGKYGVIPTSNGIAIFSSYVYDFPHLYNDNSYFARLSYSYKGLVCILDLEFDKLSNSFVAKFQVNMRNHYNIQARKYFFNKEEVIGELEQAFININEEMLSKVLNGK